MSKEAICFVTQGMALTVTPVQTQAKANKRDAKLAVFQEACLKLQRCGVC